MVPIHSISPNAQFACLPLQPSVPLHSAYSHMCHGILVGEEDGGGGGAAESGTEMGPYIIRCTAYDRTLASPAFIEVKKRILVLGFAA